MLSIGTLTFLKSPLFNIIENIHNVEAIRCYGKFVKKNVRLWENALR